MDQTATETFYCLLSMALFILWLMIEELILVVLEISSSSLSQTASFLLFEFIFYSTNYSASVGWKYVLENDSNGSRI